MRTLALLLLVRVTGVAFISALLSAFGYAQQSYPNAPIRLIVPFPAGGITDLHARVVGDRVSAVLKQPIVVENRGGAGGRIGVEAITRAGPDGYTLGIINGQTHAILPSLDRTVRYDPVRDFTPIAKVIIACPMIVVHPSLPVRTLSELVSYALARPGQINLGTPGLGSGAHLAGERLMKLTGIRLTHIPYKGETPVLTDLVAGHVHLTFNAAVAPYVAAGQMRVLATTCREPSLPFPNVPTVAEAGLPTLEGESWQGIAGPAGLPAEAARTVADAIGQAITDVTVVRRLADAGLQVDYVPLRAFADFIAEDNARWRAIITENQISIE